MKIIRKMEEKQPLAWDLVLIFQWVGNNKIINNANFQGVYIYKETIMGESVQN